jgi:hypothetical protein
MAEGQTYWKVCRAWARRRDSWTSVYRLGSGYSEERAQRPWVLEYKLGIRTVPDIGGVFAFRDLHSARGFRNTAGGVILRGQGIGSSLEPIMVPLYTGDAETKAAALWNDLEMRRNRHVEMQGSLITGTVLLDWFEPEEIVHW